MKDLSFVSTEDLQRELASRELEEKAKSLCVYAAFSPRDVIENRQVRHQAHQHTQMEIKRKMDDMKMYLNQYQRQLDAANDAAIEIKAWQDDNII